jgi:hypothetical protein
MRAQGIEPRQELVLGFKFRDAKENFLREAQLG